MAWTVNTYNDEAQLQAVVGGTVTTYNDEAQLNAYLATITTETINQIVSKGGGKFTVVTDATITNITLIIIAKGIKFTVVLETA